MEAGLLSFAQAKLWACLSSTALAAWASKVCARHYRFLISLMLFTTVTVYFAASKRQTVMVQAAALSFFLIHAGLKLHISYVGETSSLWQMGHMDLPTHLVSTIPVLLILDLPTVNLVPLLLCNAVAIATFYLAMALHGLPLAILRALGVQAVCFYGFKKIQSSILSAADSRTQLCANKGKDTHCQQQQQQQQQHVVQAARECQDRGIQREACQPGCVAQPDAQKHSLCQPGPLAVEEPPPSSETMISSAADNSTPAIMQNGSSSVCASNKSSPAAQGKQQGAARQPGQQQAVSKLESKLQLGPGQRFRHAHGLAIANPVVQKALVQAMKNMEQGKGPKYSSKRQQLIGADISTLQCLQKTCRFAIKVNRPISPEQLPEGAIANLQSRLNRIQNLSYAEPTAVRAGCVVISFSALPGSQDAAWQETHEHTAEIAKEWAQEHGLLTEEESSLSVQVCGQAAWGSSQDVQQGLPSPQFHLALLMPFLLASTTCPGPQEAATAEPALCVPCLDEASCSFEVTLIAPPHFEVRGWQGAADAPEDLPKDIRSGCVCLLASLGGQFVGVAVEQRSCNSQGERVVQAKVSLPASMVGATCGPASLVLELWAAGSLVCSRSAVLLPSCCSGAHAELQGFVNSLATTPNTVFVKDLVDFMHFQAAASSVMQQQQQQPLAGGRCNVIDMPTDEQELVVMADLGKGLLLHSLACGMVAVAGLLLGGLIAEPLSLPLPNLLELILSGGEQVHTHASDQQHEVASAGADEPAQLQHETQLGAASAQHAAAASLWTAAARGCVVGFGVAAEGSSSHSNAVQTIQPSEAGYREWGAAFTMHLHHIRFWSALSTAPSAIKSLLFEDRIKRVCAVANLLPFFMFSRKPKMGAQVMRCSHLLCWTLMAHGWFHPPDDQLRTMVSFNLEALVLVLFHSQSICQVRLHVLLSERVVTGAIFGLLFTTLCTWRPLVRSLLINSAVLIIECGVEFYFRCLCLKHVEQQYYRQQHLQDKKD